MTALPPDLVAVVRDRYEDFVGDRKEAGAKKREAVEQIAADLRDDDIDLPDLYEQVVEQVVDRLDDTDRAQQHDTLQWAADALADETILGVDDPVLDRVCAVGRGVRKSYRYLDDDDLLTIVARKAEHAAAAAAASARTAALVRALLTAMHSRGVALLGDLFAP